MTEEREPRVAAPDEAAQPSTGSAQEAGSVDGAEVEEALDDAAAAADTVEQVEPEAASGTEPSGTGDAGQDEPAAEAVGSAEDALQQQVEELTADLQRLQAEYLNYKRRVDRDRELIKQNATYAVLAPIVEVLDTIDRAREHGPLEDGFKAVADQLERVVSGLGLTKFGEPGDVFDPTLHEALSHLGTDPEVKETTVKVVAKAGYRIGERVVRAAQVLVVDPE